MSKRVQKVWNAVTTVLVILVAILALLLVGVRLVGLRPMCVLSGSMEPTYHTGSLIYVKPCAPEDVQVGDPITFVLNEDLDVVTHRVVSIDAENQHFYTKGDANDAPDGAPVYFKNLIGRPVFTIPYLGYVSHWVSNPPGMYLAIALALVLIILTFLPDVLRKASEADARDAARRAADKPGAPIYKDPTVSVKGLVADAYLFVVVTDNTGAGLTATVDTANWTKLGDKDDQTLYAVKANKGLVKAADVKDTALATTILAGNQVAVADNYTGGEAATSITFTAYLIQAAGQDDAVDAWNTNGGFGTGITAAMPTGA